MILSEGKKFISPGAWFSLIYPAEWSEFEDAESSFLFYNPENWDGNFRISAFKEDPKAVNAMNFGRKFMESELKNNPGATLIKTGGLGTAYSKEMFQEDGAYYVTHVWISGIDNLAFECSFTVPKGGDIQVVADIISSIEVRRDEVKYPAEVIPIRLMEIFTINESYEWVSDFFQKEFKKEFQGQEEDLPLLQKMIDGDFFKDKQKNAWLSIGIAVAFILENEIEEMKWMTLIDGNRESAVLKYKDSELVIDPMKIVWSKIKTGESCNVIDQYKQIVESL